MVENSLHHFLQIIQQHRKIFSYSMLSKKQDVEFERIMGETM